DELVLPTPNTEIVDDNCILEQEEYRKQAMLKVINSKEFSSVLTLLSSDNIMGSLTEFIVNKILSTTAGVMLKKEFIPFSKNQNPLEPGGVAVNANERNEILHQIDATLIKPFAALLEKQREIIFQMNDTTDEWEALREFSLDMWEQSVEANVRRQIIHKRDQQGSSSPSPVMAGLADKSENWETLEPSNLLMKPFPFYRWEELNTRMDTRLSGEEKDAYDNVGRLLAAKHGIPLEKPLRLPEHYHHIGPNEHLKQHYFNDSYLPPSHEDRAPRISWEDRLMGVDVHRDRTIQREHQSKRILNSTVRFFYTDKDQWKRGAFPLEHFNHLPKEKQNSSKNYELRLYQRKATNFKLSSNRTADMFNARGFDVAYETLRVL
ncbi:hypothetical protein RFI_08803, partial [Reticulomyxa filosa]